MWLVKQNRKITNVIRSFLLMLERNYLVNYYKWSLVFTDDDDEIYMVKIANIMASTIS